MVSLHDSVEYVIFISYSIISFLVFFIYVRHINHVDTYVNRTLAITAALFLMLCAFTHLHSVWYTESSITLSVACALVSLMAAVSSLLSFRGVDDYLSLRVTTLGIIREQLVRDLSDGYDLRGLFRGNQMIEGYTRDYEVFEPVEFIGALGNNAIIQIKEKHYRVTKIVESSVEVSSPPFQESIEAPFDVHHMVFGYDATAEVHMANEKGRMNDMKIGMCMSTAHDVRTPLSSLGIVISCLQSMGNTEDNVLEYEKLLDEAYVNVEMINLIITQFMEIGKMDSTVSVKPTISFVDMETLRDRVNKVGNRLRGEDVSFECTIDDNVPASIFSDSDWIWQILLNLVTNATKYTYTGHVRVSIQYNNPCLVVRVSDTGIGINEEDKQDIFGKFVTYKSFGHDSHGIGLYSVKVKVDTLGGTIRVADNPGGGSIFEVDIPIVIDEGVNIDTIDGQSRCKTCLVIDDTPSIRKMMKRLLRKHDVDLAVNGATGLDMMKVKTYDIVLLDMFMPVMDGLECIKRFRSWESKERIGHQVIYSMSANQHILDDKFDGTLPKPIDGKRLEQILDRL